MDDPDYYETCRCHMVNPPCGYCENQAIEELNNLNFNPMNNEQLEKGTKLKEAIESVNAMIAEVENRDFTVYFTGNSDTYRQAQYMHKLKKDNYIFSVARTLILENLKKELEGLEKEYSEL